MLSSQLNPRFNGIYPFFKQHPKKVDFAILSPMPEELEHLQKAFSSCPYVTLKLNHFEFKIYDYQNKRILLSHTGLGTTFAASVVTLICHHFHPDYLLLLGTAGGIHEEVRIRDVVIAEKAFEAEIQEAFTVLKGTPFEGCLTHPLNKKAFPPVYSADPNLLEIAASIDFENVKVHRGAVVSSNTFPAPRELFEKIKKLSPYVIDMETSALYQVSWLLGVPALAVRGASNELNHEGVDDKINESDIKGSMEAAATVMLKILNRVIYLSQQQKLQSPLKDEKTEQETNALVEHFKLQPHPEGGHYARTFTSSHFVTSLDKKRYNNERRHAGSSIYYLLKGNDFSAWHRLKSDEIWHYYKGSAIQVYVLNEQGILTTYLLGDPAEYSGAVFQVAIAADHWFAAEIIYKSLYSLVGCTVSPGFEFEDWEIASVLDLVDQFPQHETIIKKFALNSSDNENQTERKIVSRL